MAPAGSSRILAAFTCSLAATFASAYVDDGVPYNAMLFAGTHNSAINLGSGTLLRPSGAQGGAFPSLAESPFQYPVMDQRLSIRDQLDQGIRVLDFEMAAITGDWKCDSSSSSLSSSSSSSSGSEGSTGSSDSSSSSSPLAGGCSCQHHFTLKGNCFSCCPFIVSHGTLEQSVTARMGFTFPEKLFSAVAEWARENPNEIVTLYLITTHGNPAPANADIVTLMNATGLLGRVWNPDPSKPWAAANGSGGSSSGGGAAAAVAAYPTLGQMRAAGRNVLITGAWGPAVSGTHCNASAPFEDAEGTCEDRTPCMEGWDAVTFDQLAPSKAVLTTSQRQTLSNATLVMIQNLSSRRGRADNSAKYWPVPNEAADAPFQFGGNPAQAALAANKAHVLGLEEAWAALLKSLGGGGGGGAPVPNWILVDFFNTTTPDGTPSRTLMANDKEGLVAAVAEINAARLARWR